MLRIILRPTLPIFLILVALAAACGDTGTTEPPQPQVANVVVEPAADTLAALGATTQMTATALDDSGSPVNGVTFVWSSSNSEVLSVTDQGVATAVGNGTARISASVNDVTGSADLAVLQQVEAVAVSPGTATLTTVDATVPFTAEATDANGNVVQGAAFLWQSSDQSVATVDTAGVATARGSGETTITAAARGVPGNAVLQVDQAVAGAVFVGQPSSATAGEALDPAVRVEIRDSSGNRVQDAELDVTLSIADNPGAATLHGTRTVAATAGAASFSGLWLDHAAAGYTLQAEAAGTRADTSAAFDITAAEAAGIGFLEPPQNGEGAELLAPFSVAVQDEFGNTVPGATHTVAVGLGPGAEDATLEGVVEEAAVDGVATFDSVYIDLPGSYVIDASSFLLGAAARSGGFDVSLSFTSVDAAGDLTCGRTMPGHIYCWGRYASITEVYLSTRTPIRYDGGELFDQFSIGIDFGVSAVNTSDAWMFYHDDSAQLQVSAPTPVVQITSDGQHHCGLTGVADAYCFGLNASGQLGTGDTISRRLPIQAEPVAGALSYSRIEAGANHTCALVSGSAYCWGSSEWGQLGGGGAASETQCFLAPCSLTPQEVAGGHTFETVTAGRWHTCAIDDTGQAWCWGRNDRGQLGSAVVDSSSVPVAVTDPAGGPVTWAALTAGAVHTCGVTTGGAGYCWGANQVGQLGTGGTADSVAVPAPIAGELTWTELNAGESATCGVSSAGEAYCWGFNNNGQVGDGTYLNRDTPTLVIQ